MKKDNSFSIRGRIQSFRHAFSGFVDMLKTEHNAWVHGATTIVVLLLCWWLGLDFVRFSLIVLAIVSVWVAEAFNTVLEILFDSLSPGYSIRAKRAKNIAAAAVLITAAGAVILGIVLLGPLLYHRFFG
ncbi:MAG: diacylglycerol kinase family protein [Candidatus Omnitrophica bacterium]|nr:diacylglycerol kinase family protein [Candidatus Omnitrophota bacterium]